MRSRIYCLALIASTVWPAAISGQEPSLEIQVDHPIAKVSPMFYGLMTEEINFSYDGGLYGELVRDRVVGPGRRPLFHWTMVARGESLVNISVDDHTGPNEVLTRSYKVSVTAATEAAPAGMQNDGYWGIPVRPNTTYRGSFYAKTDKEGVPVTVSLVSDQTNVPVTQATVTGLTGEWKQYKFTLKTGDVPVSANNHLQLTIPRPATVWFDLISLFPPTFHDRQNGNRIDPDGETGGDASEVSAPSWRQLP